MLEWLHELHSPEGISKIVEWAGSLAPYLMMGIIFAETGLLVGFFLPGDSLLITAGVLANPANPMHVEQVNVWFLWWTLMIFAVVGDQTGFYLGHKVGDAVWRRPDGRFFKRRHLIEAHEFYERYGGLAIFAARFIPILRTFVPFAAGMARMRYRAFVFWNIFGGVVWITSLLWAGYWLGSTQLANRLDKIIVIVIFVSFLPIIIGLARRWWKGPPAAAAAAATAETEPAE
ncbi:MAG: VTT domain-containing protein [Candidatus Sumerlaeia bacterium]|nr:VTT domain-containing protein [Candidatus Sumerlaeia bacterium]